MLGMGMDPAKARSTRRSPALDKIDKANRDTGQIRRLHRQVPKGDTDMCYGRGDATSLQRPQSAEFVSRTRA